jgi:hypothetical protein
MEQTQKLGFRNTKWEWGADYGRGVEAFGGGGVAVGDGSIRTHIPDESSSCPSKGTIGKFPYKVKPNMC